MNVTFLTDSPLNSTVVDLSSGRHLYDISTEFDTESTTIRYRTTLRHLDGQVLGLWEHAYQRDNDRIVYHDKMHMLSDWLPKKSVLSRYKSFGRPPVFIGLSIGTDFNERPLSRTRLLVASDGSQYHWKQVNSWGSTSIKVSDTIECLRADQT